MFVLWFGVCLLVKVEVLVLLKESQIWSLPLYSNNEMLIEIKIQWFLVYGRFVCLEAFFFIFFFLGNAYVTVHSR